MKPAYLEECDPKDRSFPEAWKTAYWRLRGGTKRPGYACPGCGRTFFGILGYRQMHADHIKSWSNEGLTTWDNMQLLCSNCNHRKLNGELVVKHA